MACPDCKLFHSECKASCCALVPFEKSLFTRNKLLSQTPIIEYVDLGNSVLPITEGGKCTFLKADMSCAIYNERPEVCRLFGNETEPLLSCLYQKADGSKRPNKEKLKLSKKLHTIMQNRLKRNF